MKMKKCMERYFIVALWLAQCQGCVFKVAREERNLAFYYGRLGLVKIWKWFRTRTDKILNSTSIANIIGFNGDSGAGVIFLRVDQCLTWPWSHIINFAVPDMNDI